MMNDDNDRTMVRTREIPLGTADQDNPGNSVNVLPPGTRLGEFEVVNLIGEGGFGIVYLAYDHSLERHVALKEYMPSGLATRTTRMAVTVKSQHNAGTFTAGLKSFINEARLLAQFDSPSLVKVHRFWEANGTAYMVMPFYQGITLKQALKERRIQPTEHWIRLLLADLFDAIETIHRAQCFHRDIAPDNILLLADGRPLLLDFGAARRVIGDLTQCLTVILKPGFAPIEQYADIAGLRQGAWTDIYALAAVVYYLIGGKAPPPAVARIVHDEMVPARQIGKGRYSDSFLAVIDKALAVKPEHRYQSIADLRHALDLVHTAPRVTPHGTATATTPHPMHDGRTMRFGEEDLRQPASGMRPGTRPGTRKTPPPQQPQQPQQTVQPENHAASMRVTSPPPYRYEPPARPGRQAWMLGALVLTAGIASGVYWKLHHASPEAPAVVYGTSPGEVAPQSSGSSDVPEHDIAAPESPAAQAPAPSSPTVQPQAPVKPAAQPQPPAVASVAPHPLETPTTPHERAPSAPAAPQVSAEDELWRKASAADKPRGYQHYLQQFPRGRYAAIARLRLDSLQPKQAVAPARTEQPAHQQENASKATEVAPATTATAAAKPKVQQPSPDAEAWDTAAAINEAPAYEAYLNRFPNGRFAAVAKDRLASLKPAEPPNATEERAAAEKPQPTREAPPAPAVPSMADKQASINPSPSSAPRAPRASETGTTAKPVPEPTTASKKTIKVADQTMTGDFTADPKTGVISGAGKIAWADGNRFEGTLVNGRKEGKGEFVWTNGQRYTGDWARDQPNGKGTIVFPNGNRYVGEVKDGKPDGKGIMRFKDGDVHEGVWVRGKSNGMGRYTWANGSYWEGEFRNDQRTDNGRMVFSEKAQKDANEMAAAGRDGQSSGASAASDDTAAGK